MKFSQKYIIILLGFVVIAGAGIYFFNGNSTVPEQKTPSAFPPRIIDWPPPEEYVFSLLISDESDVNSGRASTENHFLLSIHTVTKYSTTHHNIISTDNITEQSAEIEIVAIRLPLGLAYTEITTAHGLIDLGLPRNLELSFVLGDKTDMYQISFKDGSFLVDTRSGSFTTYDPRL